LGREEVSFEPPHPIAAQRSTIKFDIRKSEFVIYRIIVDECLDGTPSGHGRLCGLVNSHFLSGLMDQLGISSPSIENEKARFYFTEAGWRRAGRVIAVEARRCGHVIRVIRRKEPSTSQVVFRDEFQVAVLPIRRPKRKQ
jgi:hypothetical protein